MSDGPDTQSPDPNDSPDQESAGQQAGSDTAAPDIAEALREFGASGRAGLKAANDAAKALRILVAADFSLARSAFGRTLALTGVAIAFGASSWLLLMATLIVALSRSLGWPWPLSLLVTALLSVTATVLAAWWAMRYFEHTRMRATRRQLARLGLGELAAFMPDADSHESTESAAERMAEATSSDPVKKGLGVDVTPP
ncbi:phage holin family protein [Thermomonas sp.]|uniref:NfeD family protein n=1 Tax=Thermomonas sp. TaxID=1971895 RepID=UPI0024894D9B|nr:phage holin family protein [Thermomonas sp.]MDI1254056.1 phage holin family protein [Thermomonas sp.]